MAVSLGRWIFSTTCLGALAVSAIYPAWGAVQRSRAYGGYVDMALQSLGLPTSVVAGGEITVPVRVNNLGPETADFPQVVFSADSVFRLTASSGCLGSPQASPRCQLDAPLAAGESRDVSFIGQLHPSARGILTLGAFAISEAIDVQPGNETVVAAPTIAAYTNLRVQAVNELPTVAADGRVVWEFDVSNIGPSDALLPNVSFSTDPWGEAMLTCTTTGAHARCPEHPLGGWIGNDSTLRYNVSMPPLSQQVTAMYVLLTVGPQGETELDWGDNTAFVSFSDGLFQDGMEF
jgi:hypothetical protein